MHPTLMLRDLLASDLLCYPTTIHIGDRTLESTGWDDDRYYDWRDFPVDRSKVHISGVDQALNSMSQDLEPLLTACPYLKEQDALKPCVLKEGDVGATLGFLLTLLPNLTSIYFYDYGSTSDGSENLNTIARNIVAASRASERPGTQSLSKLTHMTITGSERDETGTTRDLAFYWPFFHLPSLRSLRGQYMNANDNDWSYARLCSYIEELDFDQSFIDHRSFDTYLKDLKNLRKFRYNRVDSIDWGGGDCPLRHLVQSLVQYAGNSLQTLDVSVDVYTSKPAHVGSYFVGTLKALQALEYLIVGGPMFMESANIQPSHPALPNIHIHRLIDLLPPSIVRVDFTSGVERRRGTAMLAGLPDSKKEHLPSLKAIQFPNRLCKTSESERETKRAFCDAGIVLTTGDQKFIDPLR